MSHVLAGYRQNGMSETDENPTTEEFLAQARRRRVELEKRINDLEQRVARLEAEARLRVMGIDSQS
jgi:hypothetical protein